MRKGIQTMVLGALVTFMVPTVALADTHDVSNRDVSSAQMVSTHTDRSTFVVHPVSAVTRGTQYHTVRSGESLWSIAHHYGVTVGSLEQANGMTSRSVLKVGKQLVIPSGTFKTTRINKLAGRSETTVGDSGSAVFGAQVVGYGAQFLGTPYVFGGRSPSGFDCSGFVQFTFGHFGVYLARDSYSQATEGTAVSRSNLEPGDLVFFDTYGPGASHVGIYVGGGKFINAAGSGVRYDSLNDGYWSGHYLFGRRVH